MATDTKTFFEWFEKPIKMLQSISDCEFAVVILCFPLLERYLRQTAGCREAGLTDKFFDDLLVVFPELSSRPQARQFWQVYRNGLLHQGAFSAANRNGSIMPFGAISGETLRLAYDSTGDTFYVNPVPFSDAILDFIRDDLDTLAAGSAGNHEIPSVAHPVSASSLTFASPPTGNFIV